MTAAGMIAGWLSPDAEDAAAKAKTEPATAVKLSREGRAPSRLGLEEKLIAVVM